MKSSTNLRKHLPLAAIVLAACSGPALAAQTLLSAAEVREIDQVAQTAVNSQTVGLIVGISKNGHVLFSKGYGKASLELDSPMTAENIFRIASVTKQFTAAAILSLVEDGKLSLDDPVSKFIPHFPGSEDVTIRQLLTHTSGIRELLLIPNYLGKEWRIDRTPQEMVDYIASQSPLYDFPPGTAWSYSNSNYQVLGLIIQQVSAKPLKEYYQTRLFDRIGLRHTAVDDPGDVVPHRASGYDLADKDFKQLRNATYLSMSAPGAAGFLRSTVGDLLEWSAALFGGKVIPTDLVKLMIEPAKLKDGRLASQHVFKPEEGPPEKYDYGFGLEIGTLDGHEKIGHAGSIPGFLTRIDTFPRDALTVVVVVNTQGGMGPHHVLPQVIERIALKYLGASPE
jgi:CubicO group peptidase (beta-lactamase class C family)